MLVEMLLCTEKSEESRQEWGCPWWAGGAASNYMIITEYHSIIRHTLYSICTS